MNAAEEIGAEVEEIWVGAGTEGAEVEVVEVVEVEEEPAKRSTSSAIHVPIPSIAHANVLNAMASSVMDACNTTMKMLISISIGKSRMIVVLFPLPRSISRGRHIYGVSTNSFPMM